MIHGSGKDLHDAIEHLGGGHAQPVDEAAFNPCLLQIAGEPFPAAMHQHNLVSGANLPRDALNNTLPRRRIFEQRSANLDDDLHNKLPIPPQPAL